MNDLPPVLQEFADMQEYVKGRLVDKKDFNAFVHSLVSVWHKLRTSIEQRVSNIEDFAHSKIADIERTVRDEVSAVRSAIQSESNTSASNLERTKKTLLNEIESLRESISTIEMSMPEEYEDSSIRSEIESLRTNMPKVTTLQEVWDKFKVLEDRIQSVVDTRPALVRGVFGGGRPVHVPVVDDFSSLTNGSTKTFYLTKQPRSLNTIKAWGSDFPTIMVNNNGFTISGKAVTLSDEVNAPTEGATLVFEYYI